MLCTKSYFTRTEVGKIGTAAVIPSMNLTFQVYLSPSHLYTVYAAELAGILLTLLTAKDHLWPKTQIVILTAKLLFALSKVQADSQAAQF